MISLYIGTSRAMRARKTSGPSATTGRPALMNLSRISPRLRIAVSSLTSRSMIGCGVPAAREMRSGSGDSRRPVELAGICLRLGDKLRHGFQVRLRRNNEGIRRCPDHHDRNEILERVIARLGVEARIDDIRARADQQGVTI